jgi:dimethylaniline monooxygenase (N-oxide forming)
MPDFISTDDYCKYLDDYCTHFNLWSRMKLNTTVHTIRRNEKGGHKITFSKNGSMETEEWNCDALAICSGLNVTPHVPIIDGYENIPESMHSSKFKKRSQFGENKNVVILGAGETAMDIAYLAITSPTKSVTLCHRGGWKNEPKV